MRKNNVVLVVDDEALVRLVNVTQLEDAGYKVFAAGSAREALAILEAHQSVGILFTDVNMPGPLDGLELARLVHERWPVVRLILTSGKGDVRPKDIPAAGKFIAKPYSLAAMTALVDQVASD